MTSYVFKAAEVTLHVEKDQSRIEVKCEAGNRLLMLRAIADPGKATLSEEHWELSTKTMTPTGNSWIARLIRRWKFARESRAALIARMNQRTENGMWVDESGLFDEEMITRIRSARMAEGSSHAFTGLDQ